MITAGCDEATTDGSVDAATQDTALVITNVDADGDCTVLVNNLLKCCSATAGDAICFASLAVAFVLQDAPIKCKLYTHIHRPSFYNTYPYDNDLFLTAAG